MSTEKQQETSGQRLVRINAERRAAGLPVGRPKGTPNKLTNVARGAVLDVFNRMGGADGLLRWAEAEPTSFYSAFLKLIPKEVEANAAGHGIQVIVQGAATLKDPTGVTIDAQPGAPFDDFPQIEDGF